MMQAKPMTTAYVTIVSKKYLPWTKVQRASLDKWSPGTEYRVLEVDEMRKDPYYTADDDELNFLMINRPKAILRTLEEFEQVIFIGADVYFTGPIREVLKKNYNENALFVPHCTTPLPDDGLQPNNHGFTKSGHINDDFTVWRRGEPTHNFLTWCSRQLELYSSRPEDGGFYGQQYTNFAPVFLTGSHILLDPGLNVAYYNLHERELKRGRNGNWEVNGRAMYFFQFSGFDTNRPLRLSRYNTRAEIHTVEVAAIIKEFMDLYLTLNSEDVG